MASQTLDDLRERIDEIDTRLHALIEERASLAKPIAELKARAGLDQDFMRPGREASILRRLLARHQGDLPPSVIVRIWRELINANLFLEGGISLHVYGADQEADFWDLARGHYGFLSALHQHHSAPRLMRAVAGSQGAIGLVPVPTREGEDPAWWDVLMTTGAHAPRIVVRLPFLMDPGASPVRAFVVARVQPDPSGDDTSLIAVETEASAGYAWVDSRLGSLGFRGRTIAERAKPGDETRKLHLYEAAGYDPDTDERLATLAGQDDNAVHAAMLVGLYANPIMSEAGQVRAQSASS